MRVVSILKVALMIGGAAALLSSLPDTSFAAKMKKMPPGACAFEKKAVATGTMCSYDCNPTTMWCSQQMCQNGQFQHLIMCYGSFCSREVRRLKHRLPGVLSSRSLYRGEALHHVRHRRGLPHAQEARSPAGNRTRRIRHDGCSGSEIEADQRRDRRLGSGHRHGGPCPGDLASQAVLRRIDRVRRRTELACVAGRCGDAGHAAGDQRGMRAPGGAHRARAEGADQPQIGVRPQELFLSGPAAGLPDQPIQIADRGRGRGRGRHAGRRDGARSASSGCTSSRTPASRCTTSMRPCRSSTSTAPAWR